jgi:hypothetical protein
MLVEVDQSPKLIKSIFASIKIESGRLFAIVPKFTYSHMIMFTELACRKRNN